MIKNITTLEERNSFDGSLLYKDNEFEEKTNRTGFLENRKENDSKFWFIDKDNICIKDQYREERNCPICNCSKYVLAFNKEGFNHVKCKKCNFIFVSPVLTDGALYDFYEKEDNWTRVMLSKEERRVNKKMYSLMLSFLEEEIEGNFRNLMDIGSGSGYFLEVARDRGWKIEGIEFNSDMLSLAKKNGLNVQNKSLDEAIKEKKSFDVVTSWYVLEHIKNISKFITDIRNILKKNGLLMLAVPQLDSLANRLYFKDSPTFGGYSHINFFNKDSLNNFITELGFELLAQETQITQLNNIKKYFDVLGISRKSGIKNFINSLTPEYIHNNMLGSNLISVYKKV